MTVLNTRVFELVGLLSEADFFTSLRIDSDLPGASLNPLSNNAVDLCINTPDNSDLRLAGANALRMAIYEHDADLFQAQWGPVVMAVKPLMEGIRSRAEDQFLATFGTEPLGDVLVQLALGCVWRHF